MQHFKKYKSNIKTLLKQSLPNGQQHITKDKVTTIADAKYLTKSV